MTVTASQGLTPKPGRSGGEKCGLSSSLQFRQEMHGLICPVSRRRPTADETLMFTLLIYKCVGERRISGRSQEFHFFPATSHNFFREGARIVNSGYKKDKIRDYPGGLRNCDCVYAQYCTYCGNLCWRDVPLPAIMQIECISVQVEYTRGPGWHSTPAPKLSPWMRRRLCQ